MGILRRDGKHRKIFEEYGFKYGKHSGPQGEEGWTKIISHDDELYDLWVTVNENILYLYDEYNCGGCVYQNEERIPDELITDEEIFDYVDEIVTDYIGE